MAYGKSRKGTGSKIMPYLLGTALGIGILLAGTGIMTESVASSGSYEVTKIGVFLTSFLAGFLGAGLGAVTTVDNKLTASLIIGAILIFGVLAIGIFGYEGLQSGIWKTLVGILSGALVSGWIGIKGKGNRTYRKMRSR